MGIFSFLTGGARKGADDPGTAPDSAGQGSDRTPTPPDAAAAETPSRPESDPGQPEGPGWNFGALAEPRPLSTSAAASAVGAADLAKTLELKPHIVEAISTVFDPEIPVNIYELGLIYDIIVDADAKVLVKMTLTSPACPSAQSLPGEVQWKVKAVPGVTDAVVEVVWEPPWTQEKMSDVARLQLGLF